MPTYQQHPSSFRDPSGFVFESAGKLYRQVNISYAGNYDLLMRSGLYEFLIKKQWLISHVETDPGISVTPNRYKTILPQFIPFISYPYEWCFLQLQDAALLTLDITKAAIDHGMILKDATPYNIQFQYCNPLHIDTLSFEQYDESKPWVAYRQFCETFLFPLLIAHYTGIEVHKLMTAYPEGINAHLTAGLLPPRAKFNLANWLHVFLPASISGNEKESRIVFSKQKLSRIIDNLREKISTLNLNQKNRSEWKDYYEETILNREYLSHKQEIVARMMERINVVSSIDLGCNRGLFSRILAKTTQSVVAVDSDASSVSDLYSEARKERISLLPLCVDLANPAGDGGFNNEERKSFSKRLDFELTLALALVHHLCIGKNIPMEKLADYLSFTGKWLIIEFIPPEDEKIHQLSRNKEKVLEGYNEKLFMESLIRHFELVEEVPISASERKIFLFQKK